MVDNWKKIEKIAMEWLKEAGEHIKTSFSTTLHIQAKSNQNDLVTNIDREIEEFLIGKIEKAFPGHVILGEEGTGHDIVDFNGTVWIIDPIDGTLNFIHQKRDFAISIGVYNEGVGKVGLVYDVMRNEIYHAVAGQGAYLNKEKIDNLLDTKLEESIVGVNAAWLMDKAVPQNNGLYNVVRKARGTRSYGSAAIEIINVAAGRLDAYISFNLAPWDIAGGAVLLRELGGVVTDVQGNELSPFSKTTFLAAKPKIHSEIVQQLKNT